MLNRFLLLTVVAFLCSCTDVADPKPYGALPSQLQLEWQKMEMYGFIHFGINSFIDTEWGYGDKDPKLFNPTKLNCRQWAKECKNAGLKGLIITAKHHDGFCLWPSKYTEYSVKNSPWRDGKGDLVKEMSEACKEYGLKFGVYLSPWDRNHADYGKPEYLTYFKNQLTELLTNYGDVFEVWFDGANGGDGYYGGAKEIRKIDRKTYYNWPSVHKLVRELQPNAVLFSDAGPDCRWCGNESGYLGEQNWSTLNGDEFWPGSPRYKELNNGHEDGTHWIPAEADVSIRPSWFYRPAEDNKVRPVSNLVDIYYHSVGRNSTLLLNFPVDNRGLIHENDVRNLRGMASVIKSDFANNLALDIDIDATNTRGQAKKFSTSKLIDGDFDTYWTTDDGVLQASIELNLSPEPIEINRVLIQEYIPLGQRIKAFTVEAFVANNWKLIDSQTTIGYKRILRFPTVLATKIRINILESKAEPTINNIELYHAPEFSTTPSISKENSKTVRKNWKVIGANTKGSANILDGNPATAFYKKAKKMPIDLVIDLGCVHTLKGFTYLPEQGDNSKGLVSKYKFSISNDGQNWKVVSEGEFSNIKNNPILQVKHFEKVNAKFIKLSAIDNIDGAPIVGYAEFDVIL